MIQKVWWILCLSLVIFKVQTVLSQSYNQSLDEELVLELQFGVVYRMDELRWNKSGNNINILSELTWKNLKTVQPTLEAYIISKTGLYFKGYFGYGFVLKGEVQDSDYWGNNRTLEYSKYFANALPASMIDLSFAFGYQFQPTKDILISPILGLSYHEQNLKMRPPMVLIYQKPDYVNYQIQLLQKEYGIKLTQEEAIEMIETSIRKVQGKLDSYYNAQWSSIWIGIDNLFIVFSFMRILVNLEYHLAFYKATADWNLREELQHPISFYHLASYGHGLNFKLVLYFNLYKNWLLKLGFNPQYWTIKSGIEKEKHSNGKTVNVRMREAVWKSTQFNLSIVYYLF